MWWRLSASTFERRRGEANREAMRRLVDEGDAPGILAYAGGQPVGWCSIAPREAFPRLERSPVLKRVDDTPVWSIVCLYVARPFRRRGVTEGLVRAALDHARDRGATAVEAYPMEPREKPYPPVAAWTGFASTFLRVGFEEVHRWKATRPILRCTFP